METFDGLSDEQLADGIATWAGRVAAGEAKLLALIGEFDRREAWGGPGFVSCAHWLSWRIGIGTRAAQERVHAARALRELPQTMAMFADGRLSWSQVRAITRVATAADEASYLNIARHASGAALERIVRGVRRARKPAEDAADPELAAYRMQVRIRYDEDGTMVTTIRSTAGDGALIKAALEAAREEIDHERRTALAALEAAAALPTAEVSDEQCSAEHSRPPGVGPEPAPTDARPARATLGEAMVRVAEAAIGVLDAGRPDAARRRRGRLAVQIDPLSGWARAADGEFLPPGTVRTADGTRLSHHPAMPPQRAEHLDAGVAIGPATLPPHVTDPTIDLAYIVGVLLQHAA